MLRPMTNALDDLIAQELAKLLVLENEVAVRKNRIETLRGMREFGEMDTYLSAKASAMGSAAAAVAGPGVAVAPLPNGFMDRIRNPVGRRPKGDVKNAVLSVLSTTPKSLSQVSDALDQSGMSLSRDQLRARLWILKTKDKLVQSPKDGQFALTKAGEDYILSNSAQ